MGIPRTRGHAQCANFSAERDQPLAGFGGKDVYLQGNIWEQYLLCYYWTVATLTTNGQIGEMGPKSMLEVRSPIPAVCDIVQSRPANAVVTP